MTNATCQAAWNKTLQPLDSPGDGLTQWLFSPQFVLL